MYCTYQDIQKAMLDDELEKLLFDAVVNDAIDETKKTEIIEFAIKDADSVIDAYCSSVYSALPFLSAPNIIRKCSVDIAIFNLYTQQAESVPEARELQYKETIKLLEKIAKGVVKVVSSDAEDSSTFKVASTVKISSNKRVFSRDNLRGF